MTTTTLLCFISPISKQPLSPQCLHKPIIPQKTKPLTTKQSTLGLIWNPKLVVGFVGSFLALALADFTLASEFHDHCWALLCCLMNQLMPCLCLHGRYTYPVLLNGL